MTAQATAVEQPALNKEVSTKEAEAHKIIRQNVLWAAGGGVIPIPLIDMVAITVVEVKMLKELAALYEIPFTGPTHRGAGGSLVTTPEVRPGRCDRRSPLRRRGHLPSR
jgi:hypothetical protein